MFTYKDILNDNKIVDLYDQIEKETNYVVAHGIIHVNNVLDLCKNIATALNLSEEKTRLLLIACALHDVGRYIDNKTHNLTSEKFARDYLKNKLSSDDLEIVCNAIKYHSSHHAEWDKMDDVAYCLILADKLDLQNSRLLPDLMHQSTTPHFDVYKFCNNVSISINKNTLNINFESNNPKLEGLIIDATQKSLHTVFENFTKHFNLSDYTLKF